MPDYDTLFDYIHPTVPLGGRESSILDANGQPFIIRNKIGFQTHANRTEDTKEHRRKKKGSKKVQRKARTKKA